jgi:hypothetical protein
MLNQEFHSNPLPGLPDSLCQGAGVGVLVCGVYSDPDPDYFAHIISDKTFGHVVVARGVGYCVLLVLGGESGRIHCSDRRGLRGKVSIECGN